MMLNTRTCRAWRLSVMLSVLLLALPVYADDADDGLTLREAIDAALVGNPALQGYAPMFRALDARTQHAALSPAPEVSLSVENVLGTGAVRGVDAGEYTLAISQVLELGGKRDARVALAQAQQQLTDADRAAQQLDVIAEVTRRFITVAARQASVQLGQRAVALAEQTVQGSERRVAAAKSPHAELDRARIALDRAKLSARASVVELDTARKQLAATWGQTQLVIGNRTLGEVHAHLFDLPKPGAFDVLATQLASNPDALRFASAARLRDAEMRLATTLRRPDVTLSGGVRHLQGSGDQGLVFSLSLPLFASRRAEASIVEAQAQRDRVEIEQRGAAVKAQATLYELHRQLDRALSEAQTLQSDILPRTEEAMKETEYAYTRGRYSYLELVDAQREFLVVQATLIETAMQAHLLRVEIERLTNAPLPTSQTSGS